MATGDTTLSLLSELKDNFAESSYLIFRQTASIKDLVRIVDISGKHTDTAEFNRYGNLTAYDIDELQHSTKQALSLTTVSGTVTKKYARVDLSDEAVDSQRDNIVDYVGQLLGEACNKKIEDDGILMFSGFSTNTAGETNTNLSLDTIRTARKKLRVANANPNNLLYVTSVVGETDFLNTLNATSSAVTSGDIVKNSAFMSGTIPGGKIDGVPYYVSNQFSDNGSGDHITGMFDRNALGLIWKWQPTIEMQRNPDGINGSTAIIIWMRYAFVEIYDAWGCKVTIDGDA